MQKKNPIVGAVLGLFLIGLIYSGGVKKGLITGIGLCVVAVVLNMALGTATFSFIADAIGAFLGYKWAQEYNASLDSALPEATQM